MPGFTFLCPFVPLALFPHPILPHKLSVLFTIPLSPPWEQCVCSSPPPHPSVPFYPSIHLFGALCDISAMPGYEGEREGQALPLSPGQTHGISIVFFLSSSAKRWPVTFRIWLCQAPSFFGSFIWFPSSSRLHSNKVSRSSAQVTVQNCIVCVWLIGHLISSV